MSGKALTEMERMLAEWECTRLVNLFGAANDGRDYETLRSLLAEEASYARPTDPGNPVVGRDAIVASFEARPATRLTRHLFSNILITVESETEARGVTQILLYAGAATEDGPAKADPPFLGAFEDRFIKRDGRWLFLSRQGSLAMKA